jgi:hypothetical protein
MPDPIVPAVTAPPAAPGADYASAATSGLRKNATPALTLIRAAQLKPCDKVDSVTPEGEPQTKPLLVYVSHDGKQISQVCTASLFNAVEEKRMDMIDDCEFLIFADPKTQVAVRIEPIKRQDFLRGMIPTELEGVKYMEFDVDREHGFAVIRRVPAKVDPELAIKLKLELDKATTLQPGTKLLGRYAIVEARSELGAALVTVNPFSK